MRITGLLPAGGVLLEVLADCRYDGAHHSLELFLNLIRRLAVGELEERYRAMELRTPVFYARLHAYNVVRVFPLVSKTEFVYLPPQAVSLGVLVELDESAEFET